MGRWVRGGRWAAQSLHLKHALQRQGGAPAAARAAAAGRPGCSGRRVRLADAICSSTSVAHLGGQLAGGGQHQGQGEGLAGAAQRLIACTSKRTQRHWLRSGRHAGRASEQRAVNRQRQAQPQAHPLETHQSSLTRLASLNNTLTPPTRAQDVGDDWEAEGGGLAGAGLRARHHVAARQANRDRVALHGKGCGTAVCEGV